MVYERRRMDETTFGGCNGFDWAKGSEGLKRTKDATYARVSRALQLQ